MINDLAVKYKGLQKEVAQLKNNASVTGNATRKQVVIAKEKVIMERNVKELRTLSCTQVRIKIVQLIRA